MLCLCSCSSWRWACQGPKHVEDNVTYMFILKCALKLILKNILFVALFGSFLPFHLPPSNRPCTLSFTFFICYVPLCYLFDVCNCSVSGINLKQEYSGDFEAPWNILHLIYTYPEPISVSFEYRSVILYKQPTVFLVKDMVLIVIHIKLIFCHSVLKHTVERFLIIYPYHA